MFWKTTIPHGPPNNQLRRRGAFLDFSALLRNAHRYRLRTLSVKFLAMSYVTQVSLPSAWLYRDFTPPLDKTVCPVWYSCTALAKLGPLVANHSLGHFAGHPYSPPLSVSQLYLYRALLFSVPEELLLKLGNFVRISRPYSNLAGLTPMVVCGAVLQAMRDFSNSLCQSFFSACPILMTLRILRFCLSSSPVALGQRGVEAWCSMPLS